MEKTIHPKRVRYPLGHNCIDEHFIRANNFKLTNLGLCGVYNNFSVYRCNMCGNDIKMEASITNGSIHVLFPSTHERVEWYSLLREYERKKDG